ncbi:hypothetical protein GCM10023156_55140 [Novipirellula rosea]|uniref:Uncharacterized protein n=1 Tax=Novipirellula rosea TaxID=1031540 RepID=A0ABP8NFJ5_9BACT
MLDGLNLAIAKVDVPPFGPILISHFLTFVRLAGMHPIDAKSESWPKNEKRPNQKLTLTTPGVSQGQ